MSQAKAEDFPLLLEVFRDGLRYGVVSKAEVVAWTDNIIMEEDEPDYFFIELSLSKDKNNQIEILNQHIHASESILPARVIMGLLYKKMQGPLADIEWAISTLFKINRESDLSSFEQGMLYQLDDEYDEITYSGRDSYAVELKKEIIAFTGCYQDFTIQNYDQWLEINIQAEDALKQEKAKVEAHNETIYKTYRRYNTKRKLKKYAVLGIPVIVILGIVVADYYAMQNEPTITKMFVDRENIFFLNVFGIYFTLRATYMLLGKKRRKWLRY